MCWPTHHLVSLECHRGPIHMTFWSGHGNHLRLISSLERWGSCQGSLQRMGCWPTHHLVSLECHRGPIHMTFRSGHGTHLRLISSLERWGSCQGSLQRMGWPTHHRYYNAKFKLFPSDGVVVGTRWRFNTNDTWWSTYVNRLSKTCFVNITNHEAGNLNC